MPELVVAMPKTTVADAMAPEEEPPRYTSRNWRAEAWERERARELRGVDRPAKIASSRRSS
jgi:hypothetical protein